MLKNFLSKTMAYAWFYCELVVFGMAVLTILTAIIGGAVFGWDVMTQYPLGRNEYKCLACISAVLMMLLLRYYIRSGVLYVEN